MNTNEYQIALQTELLRITEELTGIAKQNTESGDWVAVPNAEEMGSADQNIAADVTEDWEQKRALLVQLETRYRNLVRAVEKISAGTYGICEICGQTIVAERLEANPAARTCTSHLENESELPG